MLTNSSMNSTMIDSAIDGFSVNYSFASIDLTDNASSSGVIFFGEQEFSVGGYNQDSSPETTGVLEQLGFDAAVIIVETIELIPEPVRGTQVANAVYLSNVYCEYYSAFDNGYASFALNFENISAPLVDSMFDVADMGYDSIAANDNTLTIGVFLEICDYLLQIPA